MKTRIFLRTKNKKSQRAFTLLEILLVLGLLGALVSAVVPNFSKVFRAGVQSSVRRYAALVRYAYDQAILTGRLHRIVLDLDEQSWSIEAADPGALPIDKAAVGILADSLREDSRQLAEPGFKKIGASLVTKIPEGVRILEVSGWRFGKEAKTKGQASIYAYPSGFVDQSTVVLAEDGKEAQQRFVITSQSLTGRVEVETKSGAP